MPSDMLTTVPGPQAPNIPTPGDATHAASGLDGRGAAPVKPTAPSAELSGCMPGGERSQVAMNSFTPNMFGPALAQQMLARNWAGAPGGMPDERGMMGFQPSWAMHAAQYLNQGLGPTTNMLGRSAVGTAADWGMDAFLMNEGGPVPRGLGIEGAAAAINAFDNTTGEAALTSVHARQAAGHFAPGGCGSEELLPMGLKDGLIIGVVDERVTLRMKSLQAEVAVMIADGIDESLRARVKALVDVELAKFFDKDPKGAPGFGEIPLEIRQAVHADMRVLMDLREKVAAGTGTKKAYVLPTPLEPGEETRKAGDGSRIYNPDWHGDVDVGVNREFLEATVTLVQQNALAHNLQPVLAENQQLIHTAAVGYFKSLKRKYQADHEAAGSAKLSRRLGRIKDYQRRHRKADNLRLGIEALREVFGDMNTAGIELAVCTPCQSDEANSDGEASPGVREACRKKADVGVNALEVRTVAWRSRKLTRLYMVLAVFARFVREHEDIQEVRATIAALVGDSSSSKLSDDVSAKVELLRRQYRTKVEAAVKGWSSVLENPSQHFERFRGPAVNSSQFPPTNLKKNTLYKEFLGEQWATKNTKNAQFYARATGFPVDTPLFALDLPDTLIPALDLAWLADQDETGDSDDDEVNAGSGREDDGDAGGVGGSEDDGDAGGGGGGIAAMRDNQKTRDEGNEHGGENGQASDVAV